jgi:signal transduction histidine kinase
MQNNIVSDVFINCDTEMTKTVFRNLITNAIKFTNSEGTITINHINNETNIEISISDTGVGIKSENIPFLFAIEKNISTTGTNCERGTGLGLILSKELIEKQGGKIWVESEVGKGSDFKFTMPLFID